MKNNKQILVKILLIALVLVGFGYYQKNSTNKTKEVISDGKKIQITTSFYPLYYFATQIGGDKVEVTNITPAGAEPHDYEPTTQDIAKIERSSILILNGGSLESWAEKIIEMLKNSKVQIVSVSKDLITQDVVIDGEQIKDPHVWLDPVLAKQVSQNISKAMTAADPTNSEYFQNNAKRLEEKFDSLNNDFVKGLSNCEQNNIVTSHSAFGYLASRYNLKQLSLTGLSPDQEPSPKELASAANFAKENKVKYIFFETLVSPKLSQTIAKEVGAKTISFNPLEGLTPEEITAGHDYFTVQRENLANLQIALECK